MHFFNLKIKSWFILFSQIVMKILLYIHLIQFVWSVSRFLIKHLKVLDYVFLLKVKFFFNIRKMSTSLYQITLSVKTSLIRFSFMKWVSLFSMTHCKVFIMFETLWILMMMNMTDFLHSVTLMMTYIIN